MIPAAVGCLSFSSLAFELLITRFFSVAHWSHLSFLAVGVAMFGYAAGGTFQALRGEGKTPFSVLLLAGSLTTIGSFLAARELPLDYLRFPVDPWQPAWLLLTCVVVSLPFFVSGLASAAAYAIMPEHSGVVSCAGFLGGAAGALMPALLLPFLGEGGCVAAAALVPLAAVLADLRSVRRGLGLAAAGLAALAILVPGPLEIQPSSYKALPLLLQAPGTRVTHRESGLRGRLEEVRSPVLRFAPGLSLGFPGTLPSQTALVVDGDSMNVLYALGAPGAEEFARWTHLFSPFALARPDAGLPSAAEAAPAATLVLQADGGLALACAIAAGRRPVVFVTEDPRIARRAGEWYRASGLTAVAGNPRSFLAASRAFFPVILVEDWGPSIPGMASLGEDAMLTVDAARACWRRLAPGGVLGFSRRLVLPPSDSLRLFATLLAALAREGEADASRHLAVIRSWDSCTVMAARDPVEGDALARLRAFAQARGFDLDYYPGMDPAEANGFSRYDRPLFAEAYRATVGDPGFIDAQKLDLRPMADDRPFPSHFLRWPGAGDFARATGQRIYTLLLTGEVIAGAAFVEALILSLLLVVVTFALGKALKGRAARIGGGGAATYLVAGMSGAGFMGVEMFVIDSLAPLFPSPAVALSLALGGLLVSSALGGLVSERMPRRVLPMVLLGNAAAALLFAALSPGFREASMPLAAVPRGLAALGMMAIPGFLIGMPFAAAVRMLAESARQRASAWAVNGCASVLVSFASALLAPAAGIRSLLLLAGAAYGLAAAGCALGARVTAPRVDSSRP